jgi:hypothetical protein
MDARKISSGLDLLDWLKGKPPQWTYSIASRMPLRALEYLSIELKNNETLIDRILFCFRANILSWISSISPQIITSSAITSAYHVSQQLTDRKSLASNVSWSVTMSSAKAMAIWAIESSSERSNMFARECLTGAVDFAAMASMDRGGKVVEEAIWNALQHDCQRLENQFAISGSWSNLSMEALWPPDQLNIRFGFKQHFFELLIGLDANYDVWIDWYERRIRGERAAFDIPGDKRRVEDKKILRRLAEATDEDFWGKGHEYVNAKLKGWIDEARARVAPPPPEEQELEAEDSSKIEVPPQLSGTTAYGLNSEGKLHPLPNYDQQHLRDLPDQRQAYAYMREAALELHQDGQRLGPKLLPKLERFMDAAPQRFEDAKAWPIWSAATALRTLYWKHKAVAESAEPDEAKLDPAAAVGLRGFLDIYNVFAFGDDGLRQKDENSISPQERLKAEEQAKLSQPIQQAIVETAAIRTDATLNEITENQDNAALAVGTPFADQALVQANKTTQSVVVGLMKGAQSVLANPEAVGAELAKLGVKDAATGLTGFVAYGIFNTAAPTELAALIEFVAVNSEHLKAYVASIYQSYTHLPDMIDCLKAIWAKLRN